MLMPIAQLLFIWFLAVFVLLLASWPRVYARGHYRLIHSFFWTAGFQLVLVVLTGYFSVNDLLGTATIEAEVLNVKKTVAAAEVTVGRSPSVTLAGSEEILDDYQVFVRDAVTGRTMVLNNANSLLRWKFNRQEIQLGLMEGHSYRLVVHRRFGYKNILDMEPVVLRNAK